MNSVTNEPSVDFDDPNLQSRDISKEKFSLDVSAIHANQNDPAIKELSHFGGS